MAVHLLRGRPRMSGLASTKNALLSGHGERYVMATRVRLDKVLEDLKGNPYFGKYAQKIARLQQSNPDEFLQRVEEKERKHQEKKLTGCSSAMYNVQTFRTLPFLLRKPPSTWSHVTARHYSDLAHQNLYITTPIFYVNAGPHIGHLYTAALADAIARYKTMQGHLVALSTGTDEHGTKVMKAAAAADEPVLNYCTRVSQEFRDMCDTFHIDYARFTRTTDFVHQDTVQEFWDVITDRGHIYKGTYSGWYCAAEESFLPDSLVKEIRNTDGEKVMVSVETNNPVEWSEEECYKFRLSNFQEPLKRWLNDGMSVKPDMYHKMLLQWIEDGTYMSDVSVSRPISRMPWGMPMPYNLSQSIYIWLEALISYLSALGYPNPVYKKFWPPAIQVIGKDILKFHGILWPALLIAANLEPPRLLLCHSHWTVNDTKMSKSLGNVVSPFDAARKFTPEGLRYFLLRHAVPHTDANYDETKVRRILNAELANTLGNLVSRSLGEALNPEGEIPDITEYADVLKSQVAKDNLAALESLSTTAEACYEGFDLNQLVSNAMSVLFLANRVMEEHKPWQLKEQAKNPEAAREIKAVLSLTLESVRVVTLVLHPIIPKLTSDLLDFLEVPRQNRTWQDTKPLHLGRASLGKRYVKRRDKHFFQNIGDVAAAREK